jgi:hypothetical protein
MKILEPTLKDRAGQIYSRLLLLQRLFPPIPADDDPDLMDAGDKGRSVALCAAIRDVLDELAEHARILTKVPLPLSEWRLGDSPQDERWRALTELERHEVLSMISGYANLIAWGERLVRGASLAGSGAAESPGRNLSQDMREATEYLKAERVRLDRFRGDMGFLGNRRRGDGASSRNEPSIDETLSPADPGKRTEQGRVQVDTMDRRPLRS